MFTCAAMLIVPFVLVYTQGIVDVDYNQPLLGYIMCLAYWINIIRLPYQNVMETAGHFMQTKKMAIIEAVLNVGISCILVMMFGIVGVAVGTVIAMGVFLVISVVTIGVNLVLYPDNPLTRVLKTKRKS